MGQFESHERATPGLKVLFGISEQNAEYALAKLELLSKERYQNQVSKWDLMAHLSITYDQVQSIMELLSSDSNSKNLSIHLVMLAILMCQVATDRDQMLSRVDRLFNLVSFMVFEGQIQKTEVRYVYHLAELWIAAISMGRLPAHVPPNPHVVASQTALERQLFPDPDNDMAPLDAVCAFVQNDPATFDLIVLFQNFSTPSNSRKSIRGSITQLDTVVMPPPFSGKAPSKKFTTKYADQAVSQDIFAAAMTPPESQICDAEELEFDGETKVNNTMAITIGDFTQRQDASKAGTPSMSPSRKHSHQGSSRRTVQSSRRDQLSHTEKSTKSDQIMSPASDHTIKKEVIFFGVDQDLHWTTDVIQAVLTAYNTKMLSQEYNLQYMHRQTEKLAKFRNKTNAFIDSDISANLKDLTFKLGRIESANIEYFGHRQISYMMKSFYFEQQLVNTGFSIPEYVAAQLQKVRASEEDLKDLDDDLAFEECIGRQCLAQSFKEFYKRNLIQLKYELKINNVKILSYASSRGQQRILQKKKYKTLGELCSLAKMLTKMQDNHRKVPGPEGSKNSQKSPTRSYHKSMSIGSTLTLPQMTAIPSEDQVFAEVYTEIKKLRSCQMSRRDIVKQMDTKEMRRLQTNSISFWEGVLQLIEEAAQVNTFAQLKFFKEFYEFGQQMLVKDEQLHRATLLQRQHHRQAFLSYNSQIGKIKGLNFALKVGQQNVGREATYERAMRERIQKLMSRLEKIDFELLNSMYSKLQKKRVAKAHYKGLGKISAYKTIVKNLPFERIIDYLMIGMTKSRSQEILTMVAFQDRYDNFKKFTEAQMLTAMQKMETIANIDREFNLASNIEQKLATDPKGEFARFQDELNTISEMQRLMAEAPDHPIIENLSQQKIEKELLETVALMMTQYFGRQQIKIRHMKAFQEYASQNAKVPSYQLTSSLTYKTLDLENAGKALFEYIDIEDKPSSKPDDLISWLGTLSCSLHQTYFHGPVEQLITHSQEAHLSNQKFAQNMLNYGQPQYLGAIVEARCIELNHLVEVLTGTNRANLINNLDCQFMSMPLEYSLENNFWLVQALHLQLSYLSKELKFSQLNLVHSNILLSKRSLSLNKKIAAQLILAAFSVGPQSVQGSDKSDQGEEQDYEKDKLDYTKQFNMTNGMQFIELKVKRYLFAEAEEYLRLNQKQTAAEQKLRSKYLQEDGNGRYKSSRDTLKLLVRDLNDEAFDYETCGDLNEILERYIPIKNAYFEQLKQQTVSGIMGGAKNFLEKIIKMQTKENSFGQNQTLLKFKEQISTMYRNINGMGRSGFSSPKSGTTNLLSPNSSDAGTVGVGVSRNNAEATNITVSTMNSNPDNLGTKPTDRSDHLMRSPTKVGVKKGKKKVKKPGNPHVLIEEELINFISKTQFLYDMVSNARQCASTKEFFSELSLQYDTEQKQTEKVAATHQFLKTNCELLVPETKAKGLKELQQTNLTRQLTELKLDADKIGCQIVQDVQAGHMISPNFVFSPGNHGQLGLPPQYMTKVNEAREENETDRKPASEEVIAQSSSGVSEYEQLDQPDEIDIDVQSSTLISFEKVNPKLLTEHQKSINLLLQFIDLTSQLDDKLIIKNLMRSESLCAFIELTKMHVDEKNSRLQITKNIKDLQHELINVFNLQITPTEFFLKQFQRTSKFIQRDMVAALQKTDQDHCRVFFDNVIARAETTLIKQVVQTCDSYYSNIEMDEADKLDFQTAQVKIRREFDQKLHTFKEYLDLEENKKACQRHKSLVEHQLCRINQDIAYMHLLVRAYYLKQIV